MVSVSRASPPPVTSAKRTPRVCQELDLGVEVSWHHAMLESDVLLGVILAGEAPETEGARIVARVVRQVVVLEVGYYFVTEFALLLAIGES